MTNCRGETPYHTLIRIINGGVRKDDSRGRDEVRNINSGIIVLDFRRGDSRGRDKVRNINSGIISHDFRRGDTRGRDKVRNINGGIISHDFRRGDSRGRDKVRNINGGIIGLDFRRGRNIVQRVRGKLSRRETKRQKFIYHALDNKTHDL